MEGLLLAACSPEPDLEICPDYSGIHEVGTVRTYRSTGDRTGQRPPAL